MSIILILFVITVLLVIKSLTLLNYIWFDYNFENNFDSYCIQLGIKHYENKHIYSLFSLEPLKIQQYWIINKELSIYEQSQCIVVLENVKLKECIIIEFSYYDIYNLNNCKVKQIDICNLNKKLSDIYILFIFWNMNYNNSIKDIFKDEEIKNYNNIKELIKKLSE